MKILCTIAIICLSLATKAQEIVSELKVKGKSELAVKPTQMIVSFNVSATNMTYAGALESLIKRVDLLSNSLKKIKFKESDLRSSNFSVSRNFVYDRGTRTDSGFVAAQNISIQFQQDKNRLIEVINTAVNSQGNPDISLSFGLDDEMQRKTNDELIRLAVKDARAKADLLASESGYKVTDIKEISYGYGGGYQPVNNYMMSSRKVEMTGDIQMSNFEAANLSFSESIDIVFIIKKKD